MISPKRILVTGASGFLGRHALAPLCRLGFEVHALTSKPLQISKPADVVWHSANLLEASQRQTLLEKIRPSHLLHFSWYAEHGKFWSSPLNLHWLNATLSLLKTFAEVGGKRFVGAGSCAEYEWAGQEIYNEQDILRPSTLYGATKASAFLTGLSYSQSVNIEFAWGRIFHLFGPHELPGRIIPSLIRAHLWNEKLNFSQGTQLRDFLPAYAVADAFAQICDHKIQGPINIGSGLARSLKELSKNLADKIGHNSDIRFGAFHDDGPAKLIPSVKRLTQEVGWQAPDSLDIGLEEAIEWWKKQGKRL